MVACTHFFPGMLRLPRGGFQLLPVVSLPARHPVIFAGIFSCVKTGAADLMVQHYVEKKDKINWHRGESTCTRTPCTNAHGNIDTCCTHALWQSAGLLSLDWDISVSFSMDYMWC